MKKLKNKNLAFYRLDFFKFEEQYYINEIEMIDPDLFTRNVPEKLREKLIEKLSNTIEKKLKRKI